MESCSFAHPWGGVNRARSGATRHAIVRCARDFSPRLGFSLMMETRDPHTRARARALSLSLSNARSGAGGGVGRGRGRARDVGRGRRGSCLGRPRVARAPFNFKTIPSIITRSRFGRTRGSNQPTYGSFGECRRAREAVDAAAARRSATRRARRRYRLRILREVFETGCRRVYEARGYDGECSGAPIRRPSRVRWNDRSYPNRILETYRSSRVSRTKHANRSL